MNWDFSVFSCVKGRAGFTLDFLLCISALSLISKQYKGICLKRSFSQVFKCNHNLVFASGFIVIIIIFEVTFSLFSSPSRYALGLNYTQTHIHR